MSQTWKSTNEAHLSLSRALLLSKASAAGGKKKSSVSFPHADMCLTCLFFFLTCLFKHQKSPHIPQILSYPRNKNEFKGGGGGWKLCPAQDPPGHRPWSPQSTGSGTLSHRWEQGGYQITQESPWPQNSTPTPISVQEERRGKGFHIVLAFLPFDMVLSHVSCAITKYKGGIKKQVPAAASINW